MKEIDPHEAMPNAQDEMAVASQFERLPKALTLVSLQINPVVGDVAGNARLIEQALLRHPDSDLIITPEHAILGYPSEDLVLKPAAVEAAMDKVHALAAITADNGPALLVGTPWVENGDLFNAAALLWRGHVHQVTYKHELPNYGVFDDKRVYKHGPLPVPMDFKGLKLGVAICEDVWLTAAPQALAAAHSHMLVALNASPYRRSIYRERAEAIARWRELRMPLLYVNQVGGQDELVFDGASFVLDALGQTVAQAPSFESFDLVTSWQARALGTNLTRYACVSSNSDRRPLSGSDADYAAICLGLRDYVHKNGAQSVILGMSGGIDSALTAVMAVDALGADAVRLVMLPSPYTSPESLEDARECGHRLGVAYEEIAITPAMEAINTSLQPAFAGLPVDLTEENIQSRLRGVILMALSNKTRALLLTTGNKSEMAVGYATLYGDMCGAFNCLKDLYKMEVYALARWRNQFKPQNVNGPAGEVIPQRILTRAPSAELRPDQTDQDSLPPYPVLDAILKALVDNEMSISDVTARGHDLQTVRRIEGLLYASEFKRHQAAPGVKISSRAFGRDRRYPITNRFRDQSL
jgi:NAD+ synthase